MKLFAAVTLLAIAPAAMACDYPRKPDIPIGSKASKEEMLNGQRSVKDYISRMEAYLDCIAKEEQETVATMGDLSEEEKISREAALSKKHNAAVDEMNLVAARFNEEVRSYKDQDQ
jgi:hypothetical protein